MSDYEARLNGDLIRARRHELGLSERALSTLLGHNLSPAIVRSIEAGKHSKDRTLGDIERLARTLELPLADLFTSPETMAPAAPPHEPGRSPGVRSGQPSTFGCSERCSTSRAGSSRLSRSPTRWEFSLDEVEELVGALEAVLEPAGLAVHRLHRDVKVQALAMPEQAATLQEHLRSQAARTGLNQPQVRMPLKVVMGEKPVSCRATTTSPRAPLVKAGILVHSGSGGLALTEDVRYSLLLDDDDHGHPTRGGADGLGRA